MGKAGGGEDGELFQSKEARDGNSGGNHRIDTAAPKPCIRLCASHLRHAYNPAQLAGADPDTVSSPISNNKRKKKVMHHSALHLLSLLYCARV